MAFWQQRLMQTVHGSVPSHAQPPTMLADVVLQGFVQHLQGGVPAEDDAGCQGRVEMHSGLRSLSSER